MLDVASLPAVRLSRAVEIDTAEVSDHHPARRDPAHRHQRVPMMALYGVAPARQDGHMEEARRASSLFCLMENVAANIMANLVAAAIIYVGGAILGFFPRSPGAIAISAVIIGACAMWTTALFPNEYTVRSVITCLMAAIFVIAGIAEIRRGSHAGGWAFIWMGSVLNLLGIGGTADLISRRIIKRRRRTRITGLHWIELP